VTLAHLRRFDEICGLRLRHEQRDPRVPGRQQRAKSDRGRYAVRGRLEADARVAHTEMRCATDADFPTPTDLFSEQQRAYRAAASAYVTLFATRPGRRDDVVGWSTERGDLGVQLVSSPGVALETADGVELRVLGLTARRLDSDELRMARIRLRGTGIPSARYVRADLLGATLEETSIDVKATEAEDEEWLRPRVAALLRRAAARAPQVGSDCRDCLFVASCPPMRGEALR
jgi:hypothetical protein